MKTSTTTTIEVRKKVFELDFNNLFQILAITFLICILSILLYKSFFLWSIGIVIISYIGVRLYGLYNEFNAIDLSIDISDFTMDDVMADLECNPTKAYKQDELKDKESHYQY